jgi:hypothetical protein
MIVTLSEMYFEAANYNIRESDIISELKVNCFNVHSPQAGIPTPTAFFCSKK